MTYFIYDPLMDVTHPFASLIDAKSKADDLGCSRICHEPQDGQRSFIRKIDGHWTA